jgi:hypothetical protein
VKESNADSVKDKIRKLLALSKSDNENEAAVALEKANRLMEEHGLGEKDIRFVKERVKSSRRYVAWKAVIANAVSWLYGVHHYRDTGSGEMIFTGENLDAFMAGEMYSYLVKAIERCAKKNIRGNAGYKYRRDFKYAMAKRIYSRIEQQGNLCSWSPRRNEKIESAKEYVERSVALTYNRNKNPDLNPRAAAKGLLYGAGVSLARQAGHSPVPMISKQ